MLKLKKSKKGLSNKVLIALTIIFVLVNLFNIVFFLQIPVPVAKIIAPATLSFCVHYAPKFNITNQSLTEGELFILDINYSDFDENSVEFLDNTTMFEIEADTGLINFTPQADDIGRNVVNISVRETNTSCGIQLQDDKTALFDVWGVTNLSIWDDTDPLGGNKSRYVGSNIYFFANYSSFYNETFLNGTGVYCQVKFNLSVNYTEPINMSFNSTSSFYQYNRTFNESGNFTFNVSCDASSIWYKPLSKIDYINLSVNRPPVLRFNLPNVTWNEDTTLLYYDLDDYFYDPNDDPLNYSTSIVLEIAISIDPVSHIPTFVPEPNYCGDNTVYFYATDPGGLSARSNLVYLHVVCMPEPVKGYPTPLEAGGGGGAARVICIEYWKCGDWGECLPTNLQYRSCVDLNNCNTTFTKPNESMSCVYIGTCSDNIKNCHDGLCEEGVDCGGPCPPCPTCWDGIQNQGETGIDCGGPCPACEIVKPLIELPAIIGQIPGIIEKSLLLILFIILALVVLFSAISFHINRYVQPRLANLIVKVMKAVIAVRRKEVVVSEEAALRVSTLLKLGELETRITRGNLRKLSKEFSEIMREFFTSLLHIEKTITYEELSKHIEGLSISPVMKVVMITFIKKLIDIEYGGYAIDRDALRRFVEEAKGVVIVTTEKPLVKAEAVVEEKLVKKTTKLLERAEKMVKKDVGKTATLYKRITELYSMMNEAEKLEVYDRIYKLYTYIKKRVK